MVLLAGCVAPIGADLRPVGMVYGQVEANALSTGNPSSDTVSLLHRYDLARLAAREPQAALPLLHDKAVANGERDLLFALAELSYAAGERLRHSVKPWETRDPRDYYLGAVVYAWLFLFGEGKECAPDAFDRRFRTACDLYNYGLGYALTDRRGTNASAQLENGLRRLPVGSIQLHLAQPGFPWPVEQFEKFLVADRFVVRGLTVRNRTPGVGAPLVAVDKERLAQRSVAYVPATVFMRVEGSLKDLSRGGVRGALELYSAFGENTVKIGTQTIPLETDLTTPFACALNQEMLWKLGRLQFLSAEERIATDVYLSQPYERGRVPVVFVHGTFSSPVTWAEMSNTLRADPVLRQRLQLWSFIYNSGNAVTLSAARLRGALEAKVRQLDPEGTDEALKHMVVIGHSQGGLLAKLTVTDTGDALWRSLGTNRLEDLNLSRQQRDLVRRCLFFDALPFVTRTIFISTPHRGSYLAGGFVRRLAHSVVSLPETLVQGTGTLLLSAKDSSLPKEMRGRIPTSIDSMSPKNPVLLALAGLPVAPHVQAHSIIACQGDGDYREGKDGLVTYSSAHLDGVKSECIVRGFHTCLDQPATIEEVRRILHEHLDALREPDHR